MLDYLVTSRTRRVLLHLLWAEGSSGSVSALARASGVNFSAVLGFYLQLTGRLGGDLRLDRSSPARRPARDRCLSRAVGATS